MEAVPKRGQGTEDRTNFMRGASGKAKGAKAMRADAVKLLQSVRELRAPRIIRTKWEDVDVENDLPEKP
jgi:hypothetical protein